MIDLDFDYLPIERMNALSSDLREQYERAEPYPHAVIDDLFDRDLLQRIVAEFPRPNDVDWQKFKNEREIKLASNRSEHFGSVTRLMLYHLNSEPFLAFLSKVTGIDWLIADSYYEGGGMHQIERGGKLAIHADFNKHGGTKLDRRLNVLLYLNNDWRDEYGGHFEMWDAAMTRCVKKILPAMNRMVIFGTTDTSYHGHPDPLMCPPMMTRKSLALYYYTNGRPAEESAGYHSTLFRSRPGETVDGNAKSIFHAKAKQLAKDLLPPMVTRAIKSARRAEP